MLFAAALLSLALAESEAFQNGHVAKVEGRLQPRDSVDLLVDGGWYDFQFGAANTDVKEMFRFTLQGPAILRLTDNYCAGDAFEVYDWDRFLGTTPIVPNNACAVNTTNPDRAADSRYFSHGAWNLEAGAHQIRIKVIRSPFTAGSADLRIDSVLSGCVAQINGLSVISTPLPFFAADNACRQRGLRLADLDIYNFIDSTNMAFQCSGAFSQTWIRSYWGDTYGGACLVLSTGASAPGGSINVPQDCLRPRPVLCQLPKGVAEGYLPNDPVRPQWSESSDSLRPYFDYSSSSDSSSSSTSTGSWEYPKGGDLPEAAPQEKAADQKAPEQKSEAKAIQQEKAAEQKASEQKPAEAKAEEKVEEVKA